MKSLKQGLLTSIFLAMFSPFVLALDLQEAKDQGLVGETLKGYLAATSATASAEVNALVADINGKRKQRYVEVAREVGKSLEIVEHLAGEKAQAKTEPGHYIKTANGNWVKK